MASIAFIAVAAAALAAQAAAMSTRGASLISCSSWVANSGTVCYNSVDTAHMCNPATFTDANSCGTEYCCTPTEVETTCAAWAKDTGVKCANGVVSQSCVENGNDGDACSSAHCCVQYVKVLSNCYDWTDAGVQCGWPRVSNWQSVLEDYECFENVPGSSSTGVTVQQNGVGPCSQQQCCALVQTQATSTTHTPTPTQTVHPVTPTPACSAYPTPTGTNYDWRCDCWAAANKVTCPSGEYLQTGKECTRYSNLYPNVPKCLESSCCGSSPWVY